jgi:hypothetical protein
MNNKSYIQFQLEYIQSKGNLERKVSSIIEKYDVKDAVFGIVCGRPQELSCGYLVESKKYDTLNEAIREMNQGQALRVVDNKEFIIGDVYEHLTDCPEQAERVFNIEFLEDVY